MTLFSDNGKFWDVSDEGRTDIKQTKYPGKFFTVVTAVKVWMSERKYNNDEILPVCFLLAWNNPDRLWLWIERWKLAATLTEKAKNKQNKKSGTDKHSM